MTATVLLALLGVGFAVGVLAGLVGIGGGVLIVPFLYFFYGHPGWNGVTVPPGLHATLAHATSLFIIVPTAVRGVLAYHRSGLVAWRVALPIAGAALLAAIAGARLALLLPAGALKAGFGLFLIGSGVQLIWGRTPEPRREPRGSPLAMAATGVGVGLLSALLGVGGGLVAIPALIYLVGLDLRRVAATSLAIVLFAAIAGTVTYVVSGWGAPGLPPGSLGYVHFAAALPILVGSILAVRWGVLINQRLPTRLLQQVFGVLLGVLGLQLAVENLPRLF
ncbi:MAG TPA: sulfite exporter TauE/SafE family protein [Longimicrobiales bacterium]